jgi:hypothetical protein
MGGWVVLERSTLVRKDGEVGIEKMMSNGRGKNGMGYPPMCGVSSRNRTSSDMCGMVHRVLRMESQHAQPKVTSVPGANR